MKLPITNDDRCFLGFGRAEVHNFASRFGDNSVSDYFQLYRFFPLKTWDCSSEAATVARRSVFRHDGEIMRFGGRKTPKEKKEGRSSSV